MSADENSPLLAGTATVDITPAEPIRLNGFGGRRQESQGIRQRLFARALACGRTASDTVIILTVDTLGIPDELSQRVWQNVAQKTQIPRENLAICATHTHSAPMIVGCANTLFGTPIPADHWQRIVAYTAFLEKQLVDAAVSAFRNRQPAVLSWGIGTVGFAENRRTPRGPVDHRLPLLAVHSPDGTLRSVLVSYACHCVTLSDNLVSGDWAGYAAEHLQRLYPSCQPMIAIGCGADANPRGGVLGDRADVADSLGLELAQAVQKTVQAGLQTIAAVPRSTLEHISLKLAPLPDRSEWERRATADNAVGHHARVQLQRLAAGTPLPTEIPVPIQTIRFDDRMAMVFLPGEAVADYSLRLLRELPDQSLWIAAYSNACPGYVPSERVLQEGGYEGGSATVYYDIPGPWAPGLEEQLISAVGRQLIGPSFQTARSSLDTTRTGGTAPLDPQQALQSLQTAPGLIAELVAAEPLIQSPVAVTFGPDGCVWVAEMRDYPQGGPEAGISGTIRRLTDTNGDGQLDHSQVFLDGLPFPTGVTVWRDGLLICAAPDILWAKDHNGDGHADDVVKLWSGFATHNYQARVNSLEYGLDGWLYGSCGLFGGTITCQKTGRVVELGQRDFRCNPDTGVLEPASGSTQQGRVRNDFGDWFGCDNTEPLLHYPLQDHYLRRNPRLAAARTTVSLLAEPQPGRLYPISSQTLFALSGPPGRSTAACGLGIYRDLLEGDAVTGCTLTCEPVNNLVYRQLLTQNGSTFSSRRPESEQQQEFLASRDPWFRPVQARTAPDGAVWIVDMYRFVIEHPIWIPPATLAELDTRAGADRGRIYRIRPKAAELRTVQDLTKLQGTELAAAMGSPNGTVRDLVQQLILWNSDLTAAGALETLLQHTLPAVRLQAASTLACLNRLSEAAAVRLLQDPDPQVRRHAIRLCEPWLPDSTAAATAITALRNDQSQVVRMQLACTAGLLPSAQAGEVLADILGDPDSDSFLLTAAQSSLNSDNILPVLHRLRGSNAAAPHQLLQQAIAITADDSARTLLQDLLQTADLTPNSSNLTAATSALRGWLQRKQAIEPRQLEPLQSLLRNCERLSVDTHIENETRIAATRLLGAAAGVQIDSGPALVRLLTPQTPLPLQKVAAEELLLSRQPDLAREMLSDWNSKSPEIRGVLLTGFLQRDEWTQTVLQSLKSRQLNPGELSVLQKQQLLSHSTAAIREMALSVLETPSEDSRARLIQKYSSEMRQPGDPANGPDIFRKHCSACHKIRDIGNEVGPDITAWGARPVEALLQAVLDPNLAVDPRYQGYAILLTDGRSLNGLIRDETDNSLSLLAAEGRSSLLLRTDIELIRSTARSLMPEGLEQNLTPVDLNHLYAWLRTLRSPPRTFEGNQPQVIDIPQSGNGLLNAATAEIYGTEILFERPFENIGYWHGPEDHVRWQLRSSIAREFTVWAEWACHPDSAENPVIIETSAGRLRASVQSTGGWDRYQLQRLGTVLIPVGDSDLIVRPESDPRNALADLRAIHLVADDGVPLARGMTAKTVPLPDTPAGLAAWLLNDSLPQSDREAAVGPTLQIAPQILPLLTAELPDTAGSSEEYRRIPWIWRVAIAAGKSAQDDLILSLLEKSLPDRNDRLEHWQAVVIGGGLINGITLAGRWPQDVLTAARLSDRGLLERWNTALHLADQMLRDDNVPTGTRYDALRMIALLPEQQAISGIQPWLKSDVHPELQMGAVSGLGDIQNPTATAALIQHYPGLTPENQQLAVNAMTRSHVRSLQLLEALKTGTLPPEVGRIEAVRKLLDSDNPAVRKAAGEILRPAP